MIDLFILNCLGHYGILTPRTGQTERMHSINIYWINKWVTVFLLYERSPTWGWGQTSLRFSDWTWETPPASQGGSLESSTWPVVLVRPQRPREKPSNHKTEWLCREKSTPLTKSLQTKIPKNTRKTKAGNANKICSWQNDSVTDKSKIIELPKNNFKINIETLQITSTHKKRKINYKSKTGRNENHF